MSERPFMQLYVSDFIGDTLHLSTEQVGAYLLLLMAMWNAGGALPCDPKKLTRIARIHPPHWKRIAQDVLPFFEIDGEFLTHKRLSSEYEKACQKSRSRASAGAKGGAAKALKNNNPDLANASGLLCHSPDTITRDQKDKKDTTPEDGVVTPTPDFEVIDGGKSYAFEAGIIRLNQRHLDQWIDACPDVAVKAELLGMSEWAAEQGKNWFHAVPAALAKKQREAEDRKRRIEAEAKANANKPPPKQEAKRVWAI